LKALAVDDRSGALVGRRQDSFIFSLSQVNRYRRKDSFLGKKYNSIYVWALF